MGMVEYRRGTFPERPGMSTIIDDDVSADWHRGSGPQSLLGSPGRCEAQRVSAGLPDGLPLDVEYPTILGAHCRARRP